MTPQDVLDFWFLPAGSAGHGEPRAQWFRKDDAFDVSIKQRFGALVEQAVAGGLRDWDQLGPHGALARIVLLDQFTRNAYRGKPESFGGDALALAAAQQLVDTGDHLQLMPVQRWFAYLPFEHAEDARMQQQSVALFRALAQANPGYDEVLDYAHRHCGVIARCGRFPHRNAILGRTSTLDEIDYLAQPGSGF